MGPFIDLSQEPTEVGYVADASNPWSRGRDLNTHTPRDRAGVKQFVPQGSPSSDGVEVSSKTFFVPLLWLNPIMVLCLYPL